MLKYRVVTILVNFNNAEDTIACLKSLKTQNENSLYVIIVDNASNDQCKLEYKFQKEYKNLKLLKLKENSGFGRGNNVGIIWAQTNINFEYLLLLNNDTIVQKNTISSLIEPFKINNSIGISTCKILYDTKRETVWYGGGEIDFKYGLARITDFNQKPSTVGANKSRFVTFASGCVMMFNEYSIKKLKGFDEQFFMYYEDLELSIRAMKENMLIYYNADTSVFHKVNASTSKSQYNGIHKSNPNIGFHIFYKRRNQYLTFRKHLKGSHYLIFNIYYLSRNLFQICYLILFSKYRLQVIKSIILLIINAKSYK